MKSIWQFLQQKIQAEIPCIFLIVVESEGSSPGRQGFKMAVAADGELFGSIGGGIMEHKLVELARDMLEKGEQNILLKEQIHDKKSPVNQSGMICSGRQMVAILPINEAGKISLKNIFAALENDQTGILTLSPGGILFDVNASISKPHSPFRKFQTFGKVTPSDAEWVYQESVPFQQIVHLIGGGHVGLAASQLLALLGFYVKIYDDRQDLNTLAQNVFAHEKIITDYENIGELILENSQEYVIIMSFTYRTDKLVLKQLLGRQYYYLGMMGSAEKVRQLFEELEMEGFSKADLVQVHTPVGLPIFSKTPMEIAVSVAAEIILMKNRN